MADARLDRLKRAIPPIFKPDSNPVINALLQSIAQEQETGNTQIANAKAQLFVKTAQGEFLNRLGSGYGVERPSTLGLQDSAYQALIPIFSTQAKNIRKTFYDAMDLFWGPLFTRTNVTSINYSPFNISPGNVLSVNVDDAGTAQTITAKSSDMVSPGAMTALEVMTMLNARLTGATAQIVEDSSTGHKFVNVRSNTVGGRGWLQFNASSMLGNSKLNFDTSKKYRITDLDQRCALWQINSREVIIELPAILPSLRRTLKGSHHLHANATLEAPVAPANGIWQGSFLYTRTGTPTYNVSSVRCKIQEQIAANTVVTKVTVDDASEFPNSPGLIILGWGRNDQEVPVKYLSRPNNSTLLLDPAHTFSQTHSVNAYINLLNSTQPPKPRLTGADYGIYLNSPSNARAVVQTMLTNLVAAGVKITFVVLLPTYPYLTSNPYSGT